MLTGQVTDEAAGCGGEMQLLKLSPQNTVRLRHTVRASLIIRVLIVIHFDILCSEMRHLIDFLQFL